MTCRLTISLSHTGSLCIGLCRELAEVFGLVVAVFIFLRFGSRFLIHCTSIYSSNEFTTGTDGT